jgi:hypothetical protein
LQESKTVTTAPPEEAISAVTGIQQTTTPTTVSAQQARADIRIRGTRYKFGVVKTELFI